MRPVPDFRPDGGRILQAHRTGMTAITARFPQRPWTLRIVRVVSYLGLGKYKVSHEQKIPILMLPIPQEFSISGIYLPPLLVASGMALALTVASVRVMDRYRLSRYFFYPPVIPLALMVIYTVLIGTFIIGS